MSNKTVLNLLFNVFSDTYALYLKTQRYHWNVKGPHFYSYHTLFESQYLSMVPAIDSLAERISALGEKVPVSFDFLKTHTALSFDDLPENAEGMIKDLIRGHQTLIDHLNLLLIEAKKEEDSVTEALATERLSIHTKNIWILKSSLGE
jgi:starvation-inducible DNA-binding protein